MRYNVRKCYNIDFSLQKSVIFARKCNIVYQFGKVVNTRRKSENIGENSYLWKIIGSRNAMFVNYWLTGLAIITLSDGTNRGEWHIILPKVHGNLLIP